MRKTNSKPSSTKSSTRRTGGKKRSGYSKSPTTSKTSSGSSGTGSGRTWTAVAKSRNVFEIEVPIRKNQNNWEWWCLVTSDRHWDNPKSDIKLQKKHLEQAKERGAACIDLGDCLDLMGGRYDPRAVKGGIRSEHNVPHYFDAVVADAAEWFSPYAENLVLFANGNHETAMFRHEFNPTERLVGMINATTRCQVYNGGYSGWVVFRFVAHTPNGRPRSTTIVANYHHGTSSGKSSSNMLAHERRAAYLPDADLILSGHHHNFWSEDVARLRLGPNGVVFHDIQKHLGVPGYKEEFGDGSSGWAVEKGFRPKVIGAWWLRFYWCRAKSRVLYEEIRAT